ncbi:ligase [Vibrio sp. SM6]|uniref:Ligase n=1 Tax=Vibrio agarilyticus TaxID=2726741 RepID=A0A7X8YIN3_9VIBR|nr:Wzy polymerase domain-containing protein [Vibrio agarilyticus]NLS14587.1 ligase [Vibrio agarilyticus]
MATIHLSGTQLAPSKPKLPKHRQFLALMALLFVCAMHLSVPSFGVVGLNAPYNSITWILLSLSIAIGGWHVAATKEIRYNKLTLGLALCCALLTLPLLYTESRPVEAISRIAGLWAGWGFFFLLQQFRLSNKHKQRLLWLVVLASLIQAGYGYFQYITLEQSGTNYFPPVGVFGQPELFTSFLLTGFALSGYLLARQPHKYQSHLSDISLLYLTPFITIPMIAVSGLPVAWFTAIFCSALLLPNLRRFSTRKRLLGWSISLLFGLAISIPLIDATLPKQNGLELPTWDDSLERNTVLKQSLDMLVERPISGYGYGQFDLAYLLYTARQHALNSNYPHAVDSLSQPLNEVLYWAIEGGLAALAGMLLATLLVLSRIASAKVGSRSATLALFLPLVIGCQIAPLFFASAIHWIVLIILIYWADQRVARFRVRRLSEKQSRDYQRALVVVSAVIAFGLGSRLYGQQALYHWQQNSSQEVKNTPSLVTTPWWQGSFSRWQHEPQFDMALEQADSIQLTDYLTWAKGEIVRHPSPELYQNMILAYQALAEPEKAEQVAYEARFLYPSHVFQP